MDFRLLGPLEVAEHGRSVPLGGAKQRALLAVLLLHANRVVARERLIDEIWADSPPVTATKSIQVYVARFRRLLGRQRLVTRAPGYILLVDPAELDLARFEQLLRDARAAEPERAAQMLADALALWRGPPLADLAYEPFAQSTAPRLEELRLIAQEERVDAELACGRHPRLAGELEALVAENPLRERFRCQLMLALYRAGRHAEALDAYRQAQRALSEELGLEPSSELKHLETRILQQDPALDLPAEVSGRPPASRRTAVAERSLVVVPGTVGALDGLLSVGEPLTASDPERELVVAAVVTPEDLGQATVALAQRRDELLGRGVAARIAAFASPTPGADIVRLASQLDADLVLMDALGDEVPLVLEHASCDVALLVDGDGSPGGGPVLVPFGGARHDWAALELGAWLARATGTPLKLVGARSDRRRNGRDASRLLADASLIVQRTAGVVAEPLLTTPGREGILELAQGASLLVMALSERWRHEGLGRLRSEIASAPPAPTLFVRGGPRPGGIAPPETRTQFSWSLEVTAR